MTPNVPDDAGADERRARATPTGPPTSRKTRISGQSAAWVHEHRATQADPVGEAADDERADGTGEEHRGEQVVPVRLRVPLRDPPERHERDQAEPGDAPHRDHSREEPHRAPAVDRPASPGRRDGRSCERPQVRRRPERAARPRRDGGRATTSAPVEPAPDDERRHARSGPSAYPTLPPIVEERHALRARRAAARERGELRSLGVVGGDADAGDRRRTSTTSAYTGDDGCETDARRQRRRGRRGGARAAPRRSETSPKSGWTTEDERVTASISDGRQRVAEAELA